MAVPQNRNQDVGSLQKGSMLIALHVPTLFSAPSWQSEPSGESTQRNNRGLIHAHTAHTERRKILAMSRPRPCSNESMRTNIPEKRPGDLRQDCGKRACESK